MQIEKVHNPLEALILTMLLPGIAHIPPQREPMLDALENLDLVPVLSLVHDVDGSAPVLLLERDIVCGAGQEEGVFRKERSGLGRSFDDWDRLGDQVLTLQVLKVMLFEESRVGKGSGGTDAFVGKLVAHVRRSVTDGRRETSQFRHALAA
jgi:hypothetical protein